MRRRSASTTCSTTSEDLLPSRLNRPLDSAHGTKLPYESARDAWAGSRRRPNRSAAGADVFWSVDTNGRVFHSHGTTGVNVRPHVIVDSEGVEWSVREVETPQEWARGNRCLVISSRDCVRRVWRYPDDWRKLDAESLLVLGVTTCDRPVETVPVREP